MPDHIHLFIEADPFDSPSDIFARNSIFNYKISSIVILSF
jgi:REP element-mobilizing transposase RayT